MYRVVAGFVTVLLLGGAARAIDITACGQTVPDDETGLLQGDLDCNGGPRRCFLNGSPCSVDADCPSPSYGSCSQRAVVLGWLARLDLNGHVLVAEGDRAAAINGDPVGTAVMCLREESLLGECTVRGPGQISGGRFAVLASRLDIADVDVHDTIQGITASERMTATNVTANNNYFNGVFTYRLRASNLTASNNTVDGVVAGKRFVGTNIIVRNNGFSGLVATRFRISALVAEDNGSSGVYSLGTGVLYDSVLSGNLYEGAGLDLLTHGRPRLIRSTCGFSARFADDSNEPGAPWGVCSGD